MADNTYLLALAQSAQQIANGQRSGSGNQENNVQVLAAIIQGIAQNLAGGDPSTTLMPPYTTPVDTDPVQVSGPSVVVPFEAYSPPASGVASISVTAPITKGGTATDPIIGLSATFPDGGTATFSGDESTLVFEIPHGLGAVPRTWSVTPASSAAIYNDDDSTALSLWATADGTNITVTYVATPPASGTNNLKFAWIALP